MRKPQTPGAFADSSVDIAHAITPFSSTDLRLVGDHVPDVERADDSAWVKAHLAERGKRRSAGHPREQSVCRRASRPGRDAEVSLVGMAAGRTGLSYDDLVCRLLRSAWP